MNSAMSVAAVLFGPAINDRVLLQQLPGDDQALQFIGAAADQQQRRIPVVALHGEILREAIAAHDAHRLEGHFGSRFRREQFRHARFEIASLAAISFRGCRVDQQSRCLDLRRHLGEFDLNGLMLRNRLSESVPLLRVFDRILEGRARDAQSARCHVEPLGFEPGHHLFETLALGAADEIVGRYGKLIEMKIHSLHGLVPHLVDLAANGEPGCPFLDDECAHAPMRRLCRGICLREHQKDLSVTAIGHPHFGAGNVVRAAVAARCRRDGLEVGPRIRFRKADPPARLSFCETRQEALLLICLFRIVPTRRRVPSGFR